MTTPDIKDQVPVQPPPVNVQPQVPKESIMSKIAGGFSWWIGSLTGHPRARKPVVVQQQPTVAEPQVQQTQNQQNTPQPQQPAQGSPVAEDPVTEDLEKLKEIVGKFSANVNKSVAPVVSKGVQESTIKAAAFGKSNQKFLRMAFKIFFIAVLLIVVVFIAMQFLKKTPGVTIGTATPTPAENGPSSTPTPIVYNPTKPSIYAKDPIVLKLEEDIDVLVREIGGTNIKETQLNPPTPDFGISFLATDP